MRNKQEFIEKATNKHGAGYNFDEFVYINSKTKGWITHETCGTRFERNPSCHIDSVGCPKCARKMMSDKMRKKPDEFIRKAKEIHGDEYDYSKVVYVSTNTKVNIIHIKCGNTFEQTPKSHLKGSSCNICSHHISRTTAQFIEDARKIHGDEYDYSEVNFIGVHTNVTIIHKKCGKKNEQMPSNHLKGRGCFHCLGRITKTRDQFISEAKAVHGDEYDYSKVEYVTTNTNVIIIHKKCGTENNQLPSNHLKGKGCKICYGNKIRTQEEFIKEAIELHGNEYDYSKVIYVNNYVKIQLIHVKCGRTFDQRPQKHLYGQGCGMCFGGKKLNTDEFIKRAKLVHGDKYDYSEVNYVNAITKVIIFHKECQRKFEQIPNSHLSGRNCSLCCRTVKRTTEEFIKLAKMMHGNDYDYSGVDYVNNKTKVAILHNKCKKICYQVPINHLKGFGCYHCNVSKGALYIREFLRNKGIPFVMEHKYPDCRYKKPLAFDFYLPEINMCIEFDGIQHFEPIEIFGGVEMFKLQIKKDMIKNIYCLDEKIHLLRIKYDADIKGKMENIYEYYDNLRIEE